MVLKLLRLLPLLSIAAALWSAPAGALQFYVDAEIGDDRRSHVVVQDPETPWRTIAHALKIAHVVTRGRPHIIDVAEGTYAPSNGERFPLQVTQTDIYLRSQGKVILDGESQSGLLEITVPTSDFTLREFTLTNGSASQGGAVYCQTCSLKVVDSILRGNVSSQGGDAIYVEDGRLEMVKNLVRLNGQSGSGPLVEIRNTFADTSQRDVIRNNTFYLNDADAILTAGNRTDVVSNVFFGIAGDGRTAVIDSVDGDEPLVRYNLFWDTDILYRSDDRDSVKVERTVQDTVTLLEQGIDLPSFVTNAPDSAAQVDVEYVWDIEVDGSKSGYNFNVLSTSDLAIGMSEEDAEDGILRWTPAASQVGRHAIRLQVVPPEGDAEFLSYLLAVYTAEDFPDDPRGQEIVSVSFEADTTGARDSLNTILPAFTTAASAGGNVYGDPAFVNADANRFELGGASAGRDVGIPNIALEDVNIAGGEVRNDMGFTGGPATAFAVTAGSRAEVAITTLPDTVATEGQVWTYDPTTEDSRTVWIVDLIQGPPTIGDVLGSGEDVPVQWTPTLADTGSYLVGLQTFFSSGNGKHYFDLRVRAANARPRIISSAPSAASEDVEYSYAIQAVDEDGDAITYSVASGPAAMTVDSLGVVRWTPVQDDVGSASVVIQLVDAGGATNTHAFDLAIGPTNDAPSLVALADTATIEDSPFQRSLTVVDPDPGDSSFVYTLTAGPDSMSVDVSGQLSWNPEQADVGEHVVSLRVSDSSGALDSLSFTLEVIQFDDPPSVSSVADTVGFEDQPYEYAVVGLDEESEPLTISLVSGPEGMTIDSVGVVRWDPVLDDVGAHEVEVSVADPAGQTATQSFQLQVEPVNDAPFVVSRTPADELVLLNPGEGITLSFTAGDEENDVLFSQWFVDGAFILNGPTLIHVPDSTSADTVEVRINDGVDTTATSWILDARAIAKISIATDTVDFGLVDIGDTAAVTLELSNPGRTTLVISNAPLGDVAFAAQFGSGQVVKGDTTTLELSFVPTRRGEQSTTLEFTTNDPDVVSVTIPLQGSAAVPTLVGLDFDLAEGDQALLEGSGRVGDSVSVDLHASRAIAVVDYAFELSYDAAVLAFGSFVVDDDDLLGAGTTTAVTHPEAGRVRLQATAADAVGIDGDGSLGQVRFAVAATATVGDTATIDLDLVELLSAGLSVPDSLDALAQGAVVLASRLIGDFDDSGLVDLDDFFLFADAYNSSDPKFDLDDSGLVDLDDFFLFADAYGSSARPVPTITDGLTGLSLVAEERPATDDRLGVDVLWLGDGSLRGTGLWVAYDPQRLRFDGWLDDTDHPRLLWTRNELPGQVEIVTARPSGSAFDTVVGRLQFQRLNGEATQVRLSSARGSVDGISADLRAPVEAPIAALPRQAMLYPAHPNPFNPETLIPVYVPSGTPELRVRVYDLLGRRVRDLVTEPLSGGHHALRWGGRDDGGRSVAGGVYLVEMRTREQRQVRKILLLK